MAERVQDTAGFNVSGAGYRVKAVQSSHEGKGFCQTNFAIVWEHLGNWIILSLVEI